MAHKKAGGTASNLKDSKPKYLGVKIFGNQAVKSGNIIVRQRGFKYRPGEGVMTGKDHTIFAVTDGFVKFTLKRITRFDGNKKRVNFVSVVKDRIPTKKQENVKTKKSN